MRGRKVDVANRVLLLSDQSAARGGGWVLLEMGSSWGRWGRRITPFAVFISVVVVVYCDMMVDKWQS